MRKIQNQKSSDDDDKSTGGRLPDGSLRFIVVLPPDMADLFEAEMKLQDRKKLPMARFIITTYLRQRSLDQDYQQFTRRREEMNHQPGGHQFGSERDLPHDEAARKFSR